MLAGVVALTLPLLLLVSHAGNDWLAVSGCVGVLLAGAGALDFTGRLRAEQQPSELFVAARLPTEKTKLKPAIVVATLVVLLAVVSATIEPGRDASPLPFFVAADFLFLVMPQLLARRVERRHRTAGKSTPLSSRAR